VDFDRLSGKTVARREIQPYRLKPACGRQACATKTSLSVAEAVSRIDREKNASRISREKSG
jgi:hypothetical protein